MTKMYNQTQIRIAMKNEMYEKTVPMFVSTDGEHWYQREVFGKNNDHYLSWGMSNHLNRVDTFRYGRAIPDLEELKVDYMNWFPNGMDSWACVFYELTIRWYEFINHEDNKAAHHCFRYIWGNKLTEDRKMLLEWVSVFETKNLALPKIDSDEWHEAIDIFWKERIEELKEDIEDEGNSDGWIRDDLSKQD